MKKHTDKLIYLEEYIPINGISQYLFHTGTNYENPVLLYLHGGPGSAESLFAHAYQEKWDDIFTVVHWDQRGAGKTLSTNPDEDTFPTVDILLSDLKEVIEYLKKKYNKNKIILLGHSFGSVLGSLYIKKYPEDIQYYIGVGQVIDMHENEQVAYDKTKEVILNANNKSDLKKLEALGDYPGKKIDLSDFKTISNFRKLQSKYHLATSVNISLIITAIKSPIFQLSDIKAFSNSSIANKKTLKFLETFSLYNNGYDYSIPIYYISGDNDWQTPYTIAEKYLNKVNAPEKKFYLIPKAGHNPMLDEPHLFFESLKDINNKFVVKI